MSAYKPWPPEHYKLVAVAILRLRVSPSQNLLKSGKVIVALGILPPYRDGKGVKNLLEGSAFRVAWQLCASMRQ